jgi:pimeloyl-ACP methyl ester carboxylesterase
MMRDIFVKVVNESYEAELAQLEAPTRLVWGSEDQEVPVPVAERALEILEASGVDATLEVVTGSGHMLPTQEPETLRRVVDSLMKT